MSASPTSFSIRLSKILFIFSVEKDISVLLEFTFLFLTKEVERFFTFFFLADKYAHILLSIFLF